MDDSDLGPLVRVRPPGPESRSWLVRAAHAGAPMGPGKKLTKERLVSEAPSGSIVYAEAKGACVVDVDGNRYVDFAAGFGALLLGHGHPSVLRALSLESERLLQALGDVHPSDAKIALLERLARLHPTAGARVILGQSGADAVTAALKTAMLATGRPGVVAFRSSYHGLSYAPLSASGLRAGYREPFAAQLNPHVAFAEYPGDGAGATRALTDVRDALLGGTIGAVLVEPVLGRGGVIVPPPGFLAELAAVTREGGAIFIADEIWTGLGRSGAMLQSVEQGATPDILCLGKGLGGGLPVSACVGSYEVMQAWRREPEVVHTSTFAGAPLAAATAIATLGALSREKLVLRSADLGARWAEAIRAAMEGMNGIVKVRGRGLMIGIDLGSRSGIASIAQQRMLESGYITSTGGGARDVLVLTPPLTIAESQLTGGVPALAEAVRSLSE